MGGAECDGFADGDDDREGNGGVGADRYPRLARSLMMAPTPIARGEKTEWRRQRTWTMALGPKLIGCVPINEAEGWMRPVGACKVGGADSLDVDVRDEGAGRVDISLSLFISKIWRR